MSKPALLSRIDTLDGVEYDADRGASGEIIEVRAEPDSYRRLETVREAAEENGYEYEPAGERVAYLSPVDEETVWLNPGSGTFHDRKDCAGRMPLRRSLSECVEAGKSPCGICCPRS